MEAISALPLSLIHTTLSLSLSTSHTQTHLCDDREKGEQKQQCRRDCCAARTHHYLHSPRGKRYDTGVAREMSEKEHAGREFSLLHETFSPLNRVVNSSLSVHLALEEKCFEGQKKSVTVGFFPLFTYLDCYKQKLKNMPTNGQKKNESLVFETKDGVTSI